jgi:hypothetical protein
MTEKRFHKAYCCGDTGVVDKVKNEWFIENINSISDIEKNWDNVIDKLNQVAEENEKLKEELGSFEQVSFTDLCNGSRTVLYMKKEKGDSE